MDGRLSKVLFSELKTMLTSKKEEWNLRHIATTANTLDIAKKKQVAQQLLDIANGNLTASKHMCDLDSIGSERDRLAQIDRMTTLRNQLSHASLELRNQRINTPFYLVGQNAAAGAVGIFGVIEAVLFFFNDHLILSLQDWRLQALVLSCLLVSFVVCTWDAQMEMRRVFSHFADTATAEWKQADAYIDQLNNQKNRRSS